MIWPSLIINVSILYEFDFFAWFRLAIKAIGTKHLRKRELFNTLKVDKGHHITGILGPRGAGKTILLQQLAAEVEDGFYLSADTLEKKCRFIRNCAPSFWALCI